MSARDRSYEYDMLERAERMVGLMDLGFPDRVMERLDTVGGVHGDRWLGMTPLEMVAEIRSEGDDLGGWSVLLAERLLIERGLDETASLDARVILQEIASKGAEVENMVRQLAGVLRSHPRVG